MRPSELTRRQNLLANLVAYTVALEFGTDADMIINAKGRGHPHDITSRQIAMYLAHLVFQLGFSQVGRLFNRHGTTVKHACQVIETYRDDPVMDMRLVRLETFLRHAPQASTASATSGARS